MKGSLKKTKTILKMKKILVVFYHQVFVLAEHCSKTYFGWLRIYSSISTFLGDFPQA